MKIELDQWDIEFLIDCLLLFDESLSKSVRDEDSEEYKDIILGKREALGTVLEKVRNAREE